MEKISYITILATLTALIVVSLLFAYFYNDLKKMIKDKDINVNFSLLPENQ